MANKKKKFGSHRLQTKQQASQLINDRSVLALATPPLPHTVHVIVPPNLNPPHISPAPVVVPTSVPVQVSPNHGEHSPSINHIFEDDYSDDEEIEEEADLGFYREDYVNGSKFFTSSPLAARTSTPPVGSQFIPIECPTNIIPSPAAFPVDVKSPTAVPQPSATSLPVASSLCVVSAPVTSSGCAMPAHDPAPGSAMSVPIVPIRGTSPSANPVREIPNSSEPPFNPWCNLFVNNRNTVSCPRLIHYSAFTDTTGCNLVDDDIDTKCELWKLCLVGYIAGRNTGFKALQNLIDNTWKCKASLTIHESGWLIFKFVNEEDKLNVLSGGPYLVFGRPLILRAMPEYFDFSPSDMYTIPVWVKFPNLPLKCWSIKCLSKIASVLGKPVQSDMLTASMARLSYARVLVEVNLLSDLPYSIAVTLPNGSILHQQVVYETLPRFCKHCQKLGHLTSSCTKYQPSNVPSKPRAKESAAPDPNITKGRDTVFNRLGPQGGTSVAGCSEANQPANCGPNPMPVVDEIVAGCSEANQPANCGPNPVPIVDEIVPANGTTLPNNGGWELVRRKKARSKSSQSRISSGSTHATPRVGQENSHISPPPSIASVDVAGHRADKGKSVVMPIATGQLASHPLDIPIRRKSLPHTNDDPGRGEGLPAPFPPLC
uniref:DUF4283 domain-containing protein n=1 Tax=Populus alba TaxID=43335 RepID=A0A4U5NNC8_POPAL|nr:hypothetical protein D5086_0000250420 [Populus alba]